MPSDTAHTTNNNVSQNNPQVEQKIIKENPSLNPKTEPNSKGNDIPKTNSQPYQNISKPLVLTEIVADNSDLIKFNQEFESNLDKQDIENAKKNHAYELSQLKSDKITLIPDITEEGRLTFFYSPQIKGISDIRWDFGDLSISTEPSPTHKYGKQGIYTAKCKYKLSNNQPESIIQHNIRVIPRILKCPPLIINGINYGCPIIIGNQTWLDNDLKSYKANDGKVYSLIRGEGPGDDKANLWEYSMKACPFGWKLPTKSEIEELLKFGGNTPEERVAFFRYKDGFNAEFTPEGEAAFCGSDQNGNEAWSFKITQKDAILCNLFRWACKGVLFSTRCIASSTIDLRIKPNLNNVLLGQKVDFSSEIMQNVKLYEWAFTDTNEIIVAKIVRHIFAKIGEFEITLKITLFNDRELIEHRKIVVTNAALFGEPIKMHNEVYTQKLAIGSNVWMSCDFRKCKVKNESRDLTRFKKPEEKVQSDYFAIAECAPRGWRLPTSKEAQELINLSGNILEQKYGFFTNPGGFNAMPEGCGWDDAIFITSTPKEGNMADGLYISKNDIKIGQYWKWTNGEAYKYSTRFIAEDESKLEISPNSYTFICGKEYEFELLDKQQIIKVIWDFGDSKIYEGFKVKHKFNNKINENIIKTTAITQFGYEIVASRKIFVPNATFFGEPLKMHDEIYGQKMLIGSQVWMSCDFKTFNGKNGFVNLTRNVKPPPGGQSGWFIIEDCAPRGWRLPTKEEAEEMIKLAGDTNCQKYDFFMQKDCFNSIPDGATWNDAIFITSSSKDGNYAYGLTVNQNEIKINHYWKWTNGDPYQYNIRFVADDEVKLAISPYSSSLILNKEYEFELLDKQQIVKVIWDFGDGTIKEGFKIKHAYNKSAEFNMKVKAVLSNGFEINVDRKMWINYCFTGSEDEIFQDINYGKPVLLGNQVWMSRDVEYSWSGGKKQCLIRDKEEGCNTRNSLKISREGAPPGWRLPTKVEFEDLLKYAGNTMQQKSDFFTNKDQFGSEFKQNRGDATYVSSDYVENNVSCCIITKNDTKIADVWRYGDARFATRYIACDSTHLDFIWPLEDVNINEKTVIKCKHKERIQNVRWIATENEKETHEVDGEFVFKTVGLKTIKVSGIRSDGSSFNSEHELWARQFFTSEKDTKLDIKKIKMIKLADYCEPYHNVHFVRGYAPIAPYLTECGAYFSILDKNLLAYVYKFDQNYSNINKICDLGDFEVDDMCATMSGFVVLLQNKKVKSCYLKGYNSDGSLHFNITILNNGINPTVAKDQLMFYSGLNQLHCGTAVMIDASGGRIAYGKGRICISVAHSNLFGKLPNGEPDIHQGNSFFSFDENGKDPKIGYSWGVSHSLREQMIYDGNNFINTVLGDAFPQGIRSFICPPFETTEHIDPIYHVKNQLNWRYVEIVEKLISDAGCYSAGKFGCMMKIDDFYYLPYASKKGEVIREGKPKSVTEIDEVALLKLDWNLHIVAKYVFGPGNNIRTINGVRYGKNILVFTMETDKVIEGFYDYGHLEDKTYVRLFNTDGKILMDKALLPMGFSVSDDPKTMENGTVVWTTEGKNKELLLCILDP